MPRSPLPPEGGAQQSTIDPTGTRPAPSPTADERGHRLGRGRGRGHGHEAGASDRPHIPVTRTSRVWSALIASAILLILLLIFILQNQEDVKISFLGASGTMPVSVAMLFAAVAGALLVAIPGIGRMMQLRKVAKRGTAARPTKGPVAGGPVAGGPVAGGPVAGGPVAGQPGVGQPFTTRPGAGQPGTGRDS